MFKITVKEIDADNMQTFLYEQEVPDLDVMAVIAVVNKKPRKPRSDAGLAHKKEA